MYKPERYYQLCSDPFLKRMGLLMKPLLRGLLQFQVSKKIDGLSVTGNTGEFTDLTINEIKRICDIAVEEAVVRPR